jgi:hypothetical protein
MRWGAAENVRQMLLTRDISTLGFKRKISFYAGSAQRAAIGSPKVGASRRQSAISIAK